MSLVTTTFGVNHIVAGFAINILAPGVARFMANELFTGQPGGSVTSTLAVYDTMQILSCGVSTYCVGMAASGGAVLLAGGTKGKRFALPHAKIMIHQPYGRVGGQVSDIEIQADEILRDRQRLNEILAGHTGQPLDKIQRDTERDFFMSPEQAKDYGIIDAVYTLPGDSLIAQAHDAGLGGGEGSSVTDAADVGEAPEPSPKKAKE